MTGVVEGGDGEPRCWWCLATPEYQRYHDEEWGRPVADETRIFEKLCLEGFQAGLSWLTVLRKRPAFRAAFAGFDPEVVAGFGDADVERLLSDPGIIRHRGKITAAIQNARTTLALRDQGISLASLLWRYEPAPKPAPLSGSEIPAVTFEAQALSKTLRQHGLRFIGPTTAYAAMQSLGVVNDHLKECWVRASAEQDRARFAPPI